MRYLLLFVVLVRLTSYAQGTIKLENNNTIKTDGSGTYKIPIWVDIGGDNSRQHTAGSTTDDIGIGQWAAIHGYGPAYFGLFTQGSNIPFAVGVFRSDGNGDFLAPPTSQTVEVPGALPGSFPRLTMRYWIPDSLANRPEWGGETVYGLSIDFTVTRPLGGIPPGGGLEIQPSGLAGLGNEITSAGYGGLLYIAPVTIPEPSTIVLASLGLGAIFLRRKRVIAHF